MADNYVHVSVFQNPGGANSLPFCFSLGATITMVETKVHQTRGTSPPTNQPTTHMVMARHGVVKLLGFENWFLTLGL
jgi:hypothetical protein